MQFIASRFIILSAHETQLFVYDAIKKNRHLSKIVILFFRSSIMEQFVERLVIMLLIIVPIERKCAHASSMRAGRV